MIGHVTKRVMGVAIHLGVVIMLGVAIHLGVVIMLDVTI